MLKSRLETILLTGGLGFIGRKCIEYFSDKYKICVLSNNTQKNMPSNILFYQGNVTNRSVYEKIFSENQIDYVINLAAISTTRTQNESLEKMLLINGYAPNVLYSTILDNNVKIKTIILPSTVQVYQGTHDDIISCVEEEAIKACKIKNDYAYSKYLAEENAKWYALKGLPIIITRLSNIFGENDVKDRLIPETIKNLKQGRQATLYVDEKNESRTSTINFLYIDDLIDCFQKIIKKMEDSPIIYDGKSNNIVFNVAGKKHYSVVEVIKKIYDFMNMDYNPIVRTIPIDNDKLIDTQKAKEILTFEGRTSLEFGLKRILEMEN